MNVNKKITRMGAPQKPPEKRKSHIITLRLTSAEYERLQTLAKQKNISASEIIRSLISPQRRRGHRGKNISHKGTEARRGKVSSRKIL